MFKSKEDARDVFAAIERHMPRIAMEARAEVLRKDPRLSGLGEAFWAGFDEVFNEGGRGFE